MIGRRSALVGALAGLLLSAGFVGVLAGTAGWTHLLRQVRADWWLLGPVVIGFALQVTLMAELRRRHRAARASAVSVGAGAGASGLGMLACCAHHVADLAPLAGAAGVATFLTGVQRPLMVAGIAINAIGVAVATRRLRRFPPPEAELTDRVPSDQLPVGATCSR